MSWTPFQEEVPSSLKSDAQASLRPEFRRALSDISNSAIVNNGLGIASQPAGKVAGLEGATRALDPKTPARRSKGHFTVFDDEVEGTCCSRAAASPPQLPAKSRVAPSPPIFGEGRQLLSIEEFSTAMEDEDLPDVQDFSDAMDVQEQYRRAMMLDSCDGFGSPTELASNLLRSTSKECREAEAHQRVRWGQLDILDEYSCQSSPGAGSLTMQVWPTELAPDLDLANEALAVSPMHFTALPSFEMDISDGEGADGGGGTAPQNAEARFVR